VNDLARLTDLLDAKRRELVDFAVDMSSDVLTADVSDTDRGAVAVGLLELLAKGRPQRQTVTIEHRPEPKALEKPRVPPYVAARIKGILETGILPEPAEPIVPEAITKESPVTVRKSFTDDVLMAALAKHGNHRRKAAAEAGCSFDRMKTFARLNNVPNSVVSKYRPEAVKPIPAAGMSGANRSHPRYEQKPVAAADPKQRKCIRCQNPFMSEGRHNHQCEECARKSNRDIAA
jgi:hypothetical protein